MSKSYKKNNKSKKIVKKIVKKVNKTKKAIKSKKVNKTNVNKTKVNKTKVNKNKKITTQNATQNTTKNIVNVQEIVPKSNMLYSKNPLTGEETVVQTQQINGDKFKSFMMKSESEIPPTVYKSANGSASFSMSKKRQMVVQSYSYGSK